MRFLLSLILLLLFIPSYSGESLRPILGHATPVHASPVPLSSERTDARRLDALTYLGGVALTASDPAFGGYSALAVQGDRFTLLSDAGNIVGFTLPHIDAQPVDVRFGDLPAGPGRGWRKRDRDSESMAIDPHSGTVWVGFERANAIWRYDRALMKATGHVRPSVMRKWPEASGAESMVRLADGRFLVLAEDTRKDGAKDRPGVVFARDPIDYPDAAFQFRFVPPKNYSPSDIVQLPDGRLIVLTRAASLALGFTNKLVMVDLAQVQPGATVQGKVIATLAAPFLHDNFEGIAATQENRRTILWMLSDDNQSIFQRTLLLKFALDR